MDGWDITPIQQGAIVGLAIIYFIMFINSLRR